MLKINKEKCVGCGMCQNLCSDVFEIIDGKAQIKQGADLKKDKECVKEAIQSCPAEAIEENNER
ncbi:hypothetical protein AMJ49_05185 [Parcubacteria bacterium DG_74_2]|nr:MAG: hypothetical protein AMJ49_05185 [Parcubacteria bacterium DG_74_2]